MMSSEYFSVEVSGELAMFTTPHSKLHCERYSYPMPTYSALQGIMTAIYHQRGMKWVIDECRIMNRIEEISMGQLHAGYKISISKSRPRYIYTYLANQRYQIKAHYVRDSRYAGAKGFHFSHGNTIRKILEMGSGNFIKLGAGNCIGYFSECVWGEEPGYYDSSGASEPIRMFYDFEYKGNKIENVGFCMQYMENGIIPFHKIRPIYRKWTKE